MRVPIIQWHHSLDEERLDDCVVSLQLKKSQRLRELNDLEFMLR